MKRRIKGSLGTLYVLALLAIVTACGGGGGGGGGNSGTPRLFVSPESHDFGTVTTGNTVQPLSLTIRNDGSSNLGVSSMGLSDGTHFVLNPGTCGPTPTLGPGASCTAAVNFQPAADGSWGANLDIVSNAGTVSVPLQGVSQPITAMTVTINQLDVACPRTGNVTAFVSVQDQGGFSINGLGTANFIVTELPTGFDSAPVGVNQIGGPTSVAIVMDYSTSITNEPVDVERMEDAAIAFVQQMGADDFVQIIKFADAETSQISVAPFTNSIPELIATIDQPVPGDWVGTALYRSIATAVEGLAARPASDRKAIIVVSDGYDTRSTINQQATINAANAAGIPVFTIGLGDVALVNITGLTAIADQTGGTYSDSQTTANLSTIFQQLADLLFRNQYILTYPASAATSVSVEVNYPGLAPVNDTKSYIACP